MRQWVRSAPCPRCCQCTPGSCRPAPASPESGACWLPPYIDTKCKIRQRRITRCTYMAQYETVSVVSPMSAPLLSIYTGLLPSQFQRYRSQVPVGCLPMGKEQH
jgi:hypothetical protein